MGEQRCCCNKQRVQILNFIHNIFNLLDTERTRGDNSWVRCLSVCLPRSIITNCYYIEACAYCLTYDIVQEPRQTLKESCTRLCANIRSSGVFGPLKINGFAFQMGLCCSINTRSIYTVHWYRQVRLQITTLDIIAVQFVVVVALSNREPQNHIGSMSMTRWDLCKIHNVIVYMYIIHLISSLLLCRGNTTGATCGTWTAFPSGAHGYTPVCSVVRVAPPIVFCVMDCRSLFFLLVTLLHVFVRFTAYDDTFETAPVV